MLCCSNIDRWTLPEVSNYPDVHFDTHSHIGILALPIQRVLTPAFGHSKFSFHVSVQEQDQTERNGVRTGSLGGLSIGFDAVNSNQLISLLTRKLALVQASYSATQHRHQSTDLRSRGSSMYLEAFLDNDARPKTPRSAHAFLRNRSHGMRSQWKDEAFAEEKEWRLGWVRPRLPKPFPTNRLR